MTIRPLWHRAAALSARSHRHQLRKDGATPYAAHPARVAATVSSIFGVHDEAILAAAYLHDVIEDTDVDYDDIREEFGAVVADIVAAVTKDMRLAEEEREPAYDRQLAAGPWQARLIKLADVYDNMLDAETSSSQRKLLAKADRALALAAGEARLEAASARVRAVRDALGRSLDAAGRAS